MSERITKQQIELIKELCKQQNAELPELNDYDVKQAIELIKKLRQQSYHPQNMNMGGFDYSPSFNY